MNFLAIFWPTEVVLGKAHQLEVIRLHQRPCPCRYCSDLEATKERQGFEARGFLRNSNVAMNAAMFLERPMAR